MLLGLFVCISSFGDGCFCFSPAEGRDLTYRRNAVTLTKNAYYRPVVRRASSPAGQDLLLANETTVRLAIFGVACLLLARETQLSLSVSSWRTWFPPWGPTMRDSTGYRTIQAFVAPI